MIEQDPRWDAVIFLQGKLQESNSQKQDIFLNAACDYVIDLIELGDELTETAQVKKRYMAAGLVAVRKAIRQQIMANQHQETFEYIYYGSYIGAETILAKSQLRDEILEKFGGENRKILERLFEGYTQKEIANDSAFSYSCVRKRVARMKAELIG